MNNDAGACNATKLGRIRYNGTSTWEYCNGTAWTNIAGTTVTPAAPDRSIQFNNASAFGGSSTFVYDASGNVGIGTTGPVAGLDVQNAITAASAVAYGARFQQTLTAAANNDALTAFYINPTFDDASKTGVTHNGLVVASGNVGIGTTSSAPLTVKANASQDTVFMYNNGGTMIYDIGADGPGHARFRARNSSGTTVIELNADAAVPTFFNAGKVGIGTAAPAATLHVVGDIYYTGVSADLSDRRKKENIQPLSSGQLQNILRLQPVSFTMKGEKRTELGLIAQDVQPIFPTLVEAMPDGIMTMNYIGLIGPMIEAIKEQQQQIEQLEARLAAIESHRPAPSNYNQ